MALGALHGDVEAGEGEAGRAMVESGSLPGGGRVTGGAGRRETGGGVVRIVRALEVFQMATGAVCRQGSEVSSHVAQVTRHVDMGAGEGKRSL